MRGLTRTRASILHRQPLRTHLDPLDHRMISSANAYSGGRSSELHGLTWAATGVCTKDLCRRVTLSDWSIPRAPTGVLALISRRVVSPREGIEVESEARTSILTAGARSAKEACGEGISPPETSSAAAQSAGGAIKWGRIRALGWRGRLRDPRFLPVKLSQGVAAEAKSEESAAWPMCNQP